MDMLVNHITFFILSVCWSVENNTVINNNTSICNHLQNIVIK